MAHIKTVKVYAISYIPMSRGYYWNMHSFITFTDDNGNSYYFVDDKQVSKEAGNKIFKDIKESNKSWRQTAECKAYIKREWASYYRAKREGRKPENLTLHEADTFQCETTEYDISYEDLIAKMEKAIDKNVEYIDNGRQYREAVERNRRIETKIDMIRRLMAQR